MDNKPIDSIGLSRRKFMHRASCADLVFVPYFTIDTENYNTYFRIA